MAWWQNRFVSGLRDRGDGVRSMVMAWPPAQLVARVVKEMGHDDVMHMAAGIAYYAVLAMFPLILGILVLSSFFLDDEAVRQQLFEFVEANVPVSTNLVEQNVASVQQFRGILGLISVIGLIFAASVVFGALSKALNRVWDIREHRPFYIAKLRHILMALAVFVLFLLSIGVTAARTMLVRLEERVDALLSGLLMLPMVDVFSWMLTSAITFAVLALLYKYVPHTATHWRDVWIGAFTAAALFEAAKFGFLFFLNNFANYELIYGNLATLIVLLVWIYISALIVLAGGEVASEYSRMRRGLPRGEILPTSTLNGRRLRTRTRVTNGRKR